MDNFHRSSTEHEETSTALSIRLVNGSSPLYDECLHTPEVDDDAVHPWQGETSVYNLCQRANASGLFEKSVAVMHEELWFLGSIFGTSWFSDSAGIMLISMEPSKRK